MEQIRRTAKRILGVLEFRENVELSIVLVVDQEMARLNRRFMKRRGPTDVLSFPLNDFREKQEGPELGDVVINIDEVGRRGGANVVEVRHELSRLLIHGILHLIGYDHGTAGERRVMRVKEERLMARVTTRQPGPRRRR